MLLYFHSMLISFVSLLKKNGRSKMRKILLLCVAVFLLSKIAYTQTNMKEDARDNFFWLSQMNKATLVSSTKTGIISKENSKKYALAIETVIENAKKQGAARPGSALKYEPLLVKEAGKGITELHAGRSSQDMHATFRAALIRDNLLKLANALNRVNQTLIRLAEENINTIVPNYTNGVVAQPNSFAHNLLAYYAGFQRDEERIREFYNRLNMSPFGSTVLNGTSWNLDRKRLGKYLGFTKIVDNAYDATQIWTIDIPVEAGAVVQSIALHTGSIIEDIFLQYSQTRPWIILSEGEGTTYVSTSMPQKRNPGSMVHVRIAASDAITQAMSPLIRAHNLAYGFLDGENTAANAKMFVTITKAVNNLNKVLNSLVINQERALEEINSDWSSSQEIADVLMRKYKVPFRVGHHFASQLVTYGRSNGITPINFPYDVAQKIYTETMEDEYGENVANTTFPMLEDEFKATVDPKNIMLNRQTIGSSSPKEIKRMLKNAKTEMRNQSAWINNSVNHINSSLKQLDNDFMKLAK